MLWGYQPGLGLSKPPLASIPTPRRIPPPPSVTLQGLYIFATRSRLDASVRGGLEAASLSSAVLSPFVVAITGGRKPAAAHFHHCTARFAHRAAPAARQSQSPLSWIFVTRLWTLSRFMRPFCPSTMAVSSRQTSYNRTASSSIASAAAAVWPSSGSAAAAV